MEVTQLKNVLDYHWIDKIIGEHADFNAYDKGDDCVMFTVRNKETGYNIVDLSIYGYSRSFFEENEVSDLLTDKSGCIVIRESYHDKGEMFVYNSETKQNKT